MKKVLIICYYWPPNAGVGASRWVEMSKHFLSTHWKPFVFTAENPSFSLSDHLEDPEIQKIPILKRKIWEPVDQLKSVLGLKQIQQGIAAEGNQNSLLNKLLVWSRGNLIVPDPKIKWAKESVDFVCAYINKENIDMIVSTGPPHSMHVLGQRVSEKTNLPWIMDLRDPWSKWDLMDALKVGKRAMKKHEHLEKFLLDKCDAVVTVSKSWAKDFKRLTDTKVYIVPNGASDKEAQSRKYGHEGSPKSKEAQSRKYAAVRKEGISESNLASKGFVVLYAGLLNESRNSSAFWKALDSALEKNKNLKNDFALVFLGNVSPSVRANIESFKNVKEIVQFEGYVGKAKVEEYTSEAHVLLNLVSIEPKAFGNIPVKFYEYLMTDKPIINICPKESDVFEIGQSFEGIWQGEKVEEIINKLMGYYNSFRESGTYQKFKRQSAYTRKSSAKMMIEIFENISS